MGIFNTLFGSSTTLKESFAMLDAEREHIYALETQNGLLRESLESLRLEDYLWDPIVGWNKAGGLELTSLKREADHCQQLYAVNPLIKKAVTARVGLIHGRNNRIINEDGSSSTALDKYVKENSRAVFGNVARARLEAELSSSGNVWAMVIGSEPVTIVPLNQISGYISRSTNPAEVLYWRRNYSYQQVDFATGNESTVVVDEYIPTNLVKTPATAIGPTPVRGNARMYHIAANRQEGWVFGLPDIFAAKFWTQGHKEMFEAGHEYALAQGQFAAKVTGGTGNGVQLAASRLADFPRRDPDTGESYGYGGIAAMSDGLDLQLMNKMGSGVDFKSYDRIAGLIAVGTGVPLKVILGESDSEEVSLEQTVIDDMRLRQDLWGEFYDDILGKFKAKVIWPRIKQDSLYRVQQSIEIANRTNTLSAEEKRLIALEAFGLEGKATELPGIEDHPDVMVYRAKKEIDLEYAPLIAQASGQDNNADMKRSTTPDQGNDQGIGKLSDGADAHAARDAGEQDHTK